MTEVKTGASGDYFAEGLLSALPNQDPVYASFDAQRVSADVGFDFVNIDGTLARALDEVRETQEAYVDHTRDETDDTLHHLGDEISDLVFSGVNLGRWQGLTPAEMMSMEDVRAVAEREQAPDSFEEGLGMVAISMRAAAETTDREEAIRIVEQIFVGAQHLANLYGFDMDALLRANVEKYLTRCVAVEELARANGKTWRNMADAGEIIQYWKAAKARL